MKYKLVDADQLDSDLTSIADKVREKAEMSGKLEFPTGIIDAVDQCSSLNFTVVGGMMQPTDPKENTIWVKTDADITGWAFIANEPIKPIDGMIWFGVGVFSAAEFNSLKKNTIQVYPVSAKQYTGGSWSAVDYGVYQNAEWKDSEFYLYLSGNEYTDVTGGWKTAGGSGQTVTLSENSIVFKRTGDGIRKINAFPNNRIDVTSHQSLRITGYVTAVGWKLAFGLTTTSDDTDDPTWVASKTITETGNFDVEVDISFATGVHYVVVHGHSVDAEVNSVSLK